jgi:hypothetical protein
LWREIKPFISRCFESLAVTRRIYQWFSRGAFEPVFKAARDNDPFAFLVLADLAYRLRHRNLTAPLMNVPKRVFTGMGMQVCFHRRFNHLDLYFHEISVTDVPGFFHTFKIGRSVSKFFRILSHRVTSRQNLSYLSPVRPARSSVGSKRVMYGSVCKLVGEREWEKEWFSHLARKGISSWLRERLGYFLIGKKQKGC